MNPNLEQLINLTLWESSVWAIIFTSLWLIVTLVSISSKSFFTTLVSFALFFTLFGIWGSIPPWEINYLKTINFWLIYILIGFVFACVKTFFYAKEIKSSYSFSLKSKTTTHEQLLDTIKNRIRKNVLSWWMLWPFELIIWLLSDLMSQLWKFIWSNIQGLFNGIVKLAIGKPTNTND